MDQKSSNKKGRQKIEIGKKESPNSVILFHGYSGSTGDFESLPEKIVKHIDARVIVPLLPGHGTKVEDLLPYELHDFLKATKQIVDTEIKNGKKLLLGGHSFGAYLALLIGAQTNPQGVITTSIPYRMRFPFIFPIGIAVSKTKKIWEKKLSNKERESRGSAFYYDHIPGKSLRLVYEAKRLLKKEGSKLTAPILSIHTHEDSVAYAVSSKKSLKHTQSKNPQSLILKNGKHSIFYDSNSKESAINAILDFISKRFK